MLSVLILVAAGYFLGFNIKRDQYILTTALMSERLFSLRADLGFVRAMLGTVSRRKQRLFHLPLAASVLVDGDWTSFRG